jgi:hypothetical protein
MPADLMEGGGHVHRPRREAVEAAPDDRLTEDPHVKIKHRQSPSYGHGSNVLGSISSPPAFTSDGT